MSQPAAPPSPPREPAPSAWALPSLRERLKRARRPNAPQGDVDVLVAGLAPDAVTEALTSQERAELLLDILQDRHLARRKARSGREVRHVAAEALLALDPAYARQLPPGSLPPPTPPPPVHEVPWSPMTAMGLLLALGVCGAEWLYLIQRWTVTVSITGARSHGVYTRTVWERVVLYGLLSLVPLLSALFAAAKRKREPLQGAAWVLLGSGAARLVRALAAAAFPLTAGMKDGDGALLLLTGAGLLLSGFCLRPPPRRPRAR
jgi:hypothetical protein